MKRMESCSQKIYCIPWSVLSKDLTDFVSLEIIVVSDAITEQTIRYI